MKLLIAFLTVAASLFTNVSSATDKIEIAPAAIQSFKSTFVDASEVCWSVSNNLYKADFALNGQYASVFYEADGNLVATSRNISSLQLPITLQASLRKDYSGYWISDLIEMTTEDGLAYYVTLQNSDNKLILKGSALTEWVTFQKTRKP
ncbi:hypothetical protein [Flavisolibacter tropicus]|uniref:Beta-lactamase-inhibitor-like PepSY-like domain-containing protein n=1 Tax=Flavisolibacter tropicus TaxID=1492898 RepID=A0A172TVX0_9BACT|nr:hypothetical protein [Flavisolibacter tropicus]ANE51180.1 hypothetical protein SY85_12375 [Flavisolibacter tropicus]